jgi:pyrroloquinoline quinone biosynthesis protein D
MHMSLPATYRQGLSFQGRDHGLLGIDMDMDSIPALAPGCRLHPTQDVLLVPEGTLQLAGPSRDVLARVDGAHSVTAIVDELLLEYEGADAMEVRTDVLELLASLEQRGVVRARR